MSFKMSNIGAPENAQPIEVNGQVIDPSKKYARDAPNTNYIIIAVRDVLSNNPKVKQLD